MMSFNEFVHAFTDGIKDYLPPDYHDAEIWAERVVKTNDQILTGINIRRSGDLVSPRIYVDGMYEDYIHGKSMEEVFCDARDTWSWALKQAPERDVVQNILNDLEKAKGMISYRLINRKANEEYLAERPWTPIADLACVYQLELGCGQRAPINNTHMEKLGLTLQEIHDLSMENTPKLLPASVQTIGAALGIPFEDDDLVVIANTDLADGAGTILYPSVQEALTERLGEFWILPCSVHEVLAAKKSPDVSLDNLQRMVREINNSTVLRPQDVLSNEVYELNGRVLTIAHESPSVKMETPLRDDDAR